MEGLRIGVIGYTNLSSGIGLFVWEFLHYLGADSVLSVEAGIKGREDWGRQLSAHRPPSETELRRYFERFAPAVVLFLETPFNDALYRIAPEYGIRTVGVPMHETFAAERLAADLLICPCPSAWSKAAGEKVLMFLPIGLDMFPYRERRGHVFVMNIGYGWHADRRQCAVVVEAFRRLRDPGARLILYAQQRWPEGAVVSDPRISYRLRNAEHPADNYAEGDILIAPMAYEGYGRTVLEGMASGMPVLTTDADPMNLFQHDPDLLIKPHEVIEHWSGRWVRDVSYNRISSDDMHRKLEWLLTIDTPEYSRRARRQAEAQSWQSRDIDYRRAWRETLEELCSSG